MKKIFFRQIVFIPILYVLTKFLWDSIPIGLLPDMINVVINDLFGPIFIMAIIILLFIQILWKVPILGRLSQFLFGTKPCFQGTWQGKMNYEWEGNKEKKVFLVIKQPNGYSLNIWLLTDERTSSSIFTDITTSKSIQRIIYTYANEESPDNKIINPSHEGFCKLDFDNETNILQGIYYTSRKTVGKLCFDKRNSKVILNFEKAKKIFGI